MQPVRKLAVIAVTLLAALAAAWPASAAGQPSPVQGITLVSGPPEARGATVSAADLGHGLVAGTTPYVHPDGFVYTDVFAPFLWSAHASSSPSSSSSVLFQLPANLATFPSIYLPNAITPNGRTVVGGVIFPEELFTEPWAWTQAGGLQFLQLPANTQYGGGAVGVSSDGSIIAGTLAGRFVPWQAATWVNGQLETLPTSQVWSQVHAISGDGSTVVGAAGRSLGTMQADRWVNGIEQPLSTGGLNPVSSAALFVADNGVAFGTATLSSGLTLLLRWAPDGTLTVLTPPDGLSVASLSSIDSVGGAAGGALAEKTSCISFLDPACNQEPFVWTAQDGFTILSQGTLGQSLDQFGDASTVTSVSDGGRVAVGALQPRESINGFPPHVGVVWTSQSGPVSVNDLMSSFGQPNPDYFSAGSVSPNGTTVLAFGNAPNEAVNDTGSLLLDLNPLWTGQPGSVTATQPSSGTPQAAQSTEDALGQQLMSLPADVLGEAQSWPGAASILGQIDLLPGDATASSGG
jgi:uncharacterized membrane protein